MDYLGIEELPKRHVLKRWTRDARDILPDHTRRVRGGRNHSPTVIPEYTRKHLNWSG
jgi:hypothetical protein